MNLSAQDHQTFFTGDTQQLKPEDAGEFYYYLCICRNVFSFSLFDKDSLSGTPDDVLLYILVIKIVFLSYFVLFFSKIFSYTYYEPLIS